jgi:hypothetical protein
MRRNRAALTNRSRLFGSIATPVPTEILARTRVSPICDNDFRSPTLLRRFDQPNVGFSDLLGIGLGRSCNDLLTHSHPPYSVHSLPPMWLALRKRGAMWVLRLPEARHLMTVRNRQLHSLGFTHGTLFFDQSPQEVPPEGSDYSPRSHCVWKILVRDEHRSKGHC